MSIFRSNSPHNRLDNNRGVFSKANYIEYYYSLCVCLFVGSGTSFSRGHSGTLSPLLSFFLIYPIPLHAFLFEPRFLSPRQYISDRGIFFWQTHRGKCARIASLSLPIILMSTTDCTPAHTQTQYTHAHTRIRPDSMGLTDEETMLNIEERISSVGLFMAMIVIKNVPYHHRSPALSRVIDWGRKGGTFHFAPGKIYARSAKPRKKRRRMRMKKNPGIVFPA